jgi:hypothetical protein
MVENKSILNKIFKSKTPFLIDEIIIDSVNECRSIQPFIKNKIYSKEEIQLESFEKQNFKDKDGFYVYQRIKSVKVGFEFFWNGYLDLNERPLIFHLLSLIPYAVYETDINLSEIIYHSYFNGNRFLKYLPHKKYIFFSGEKYPFPCEKYNLSLSFKSDSENNICYPFFFSVLHSYQPRYDNIFLNSHSKHIPQDFCAFIVSNPSCSIRNKFFQYLSTNYKNVKSYGKYMNNVGYVLDFPYNDERQIELLKKHKFVICFENTKLDEYYITEKILIAKSAGTIPIYWGSNKCLELFNHNSFLYLEDETEESLKKILNKIILLDNNPELYLKVRNEPLIKEEIKPIFDKKNLESKIHKILFK